MPFGFMSDVGAAIRGVWDPGYYSGEYMERKSEYRLAARTLRKKEKTSRKRTRQTSKTKKVGMRQRGRSSRTESTGKRAFAGGAGAGAGILGGAALLGAGAAAAAGIKGPWAAIANAAGGLTPDQMSRMQAGQMPTSADEGGMSTPMMLGAAVLAGGLIYVATQQGGK